MGYWGWRPLVCGMFISTWVTGCTIVASTSAPPTNPTRYPSIALTSGRLPDPTAPPLGSAYDTLLSVSVVPAETGASPLVVLAPTCYPLGERMVCLGGLVNPGTSPLTGALIEVVLTDQGERRVQQVTLDQRVIASGGRAPWRAEFSISDGRAVQIAVRVVSAQTGPADRVITPPVTGLHTAAHADGRRWLVSGSVHNPTADPLRLTQAIATLYDSADRVLGYRVLALDQGGAPLAAGESRRVEVEVFALNGTTGPPDPGRTALHVEGERAALIQR